MAPNEAESRRIKTVDPKCGVAREPAELMHRLYMAYFIEAYTFKATCAMAAIVGMAEVMPKAGVVLLVNLGYQNEREAPNGTHSPLRSNDL